MRIFRLLPFLVVAQSNRKIGMEQLSKINLMPVNKGKIDGAPMFAEELWKKEPAMVFIVRRPG